MSARRLGLIVLVSALTHLKGIRAPMLDYAYHRQCNTAAIARNYHENGLRFFYPQIDWEGPYNGRAATEFPLFMWLTGVLWPLAGLGDSWGRILSSAFSALTAGTLYLFLKTKLAEDEAFFAGLIFCCLPLEVFFGRTVQPEATALFSVVASVYFWDRSLAPPRRLRDWGAAVFFAFLAIAHKLPYAHILLPLAALSWTKLGRAALRDARTLAAAPLAVLAVFAWYRYASAGTFVVPTHGGEFLSLLNYSTLPYNASYQFYSRFPELSATWPGMILVVLGLRELWRRRDAFLGAWFLSVCAMIAAGGAYTFHHEYTSLAFAPINAAIMALGLSRLKERSKSAALAVFLLVPAFGLFRIKHWYESSYLYLLNAQKAADAVSRKDDLFLCNERGGSVFLYYLHRKGWSRDLYEAGEKNLGEIDQRIAQGATFYATHKDGYFVANEGLARYIRERFGPPIYDADGLLIFRLTPRLERPARAGR